MLFTGLGDKYLRNDGTYANSLVLLGPQPYTGSLAGVNAKLLILAATGSSVSTALPVLQTNINNLIQTLGGTIGTYSSTTGIYFNCYNLGSNNDIKTFGTNGYDSTYDMVLHYNNGFIGTTNDTSVLDTWYNNNKGVVLCMYDVSTNYPVNITKTITSYSNYLYNLTNAYAQSSTHPILYGVSSVIPTSYGTTFNSINNAIGIGSINGSNAVNYLDDLTGKGRRVDINLQPADAGKIDTTSIGAVRLILQSMLYAARKI